MSFWPLLQLALPGPRWLVWWARGTCETPTYHRGIMRHWGCHLRRTLGQLQSQLRSYGGAVGRGRPPVGCFGALTKFVSGTGWMSGFLPSGRAIAVAPVNRKPQNRTFHQNSIFYRTQPQVCCSGQASKAQAQQEGERRLVSSGN